ncbi:MAG TPA: endopeptidase La [Thermomicrobiales bacterium]|nr:endopeptidase La [Thermomicrobiales bacterium]
MRQHDDASGRPGRERMTRIPVLPLKNFVIFPRNVVTMLAAHHRSIHAVEEAMMTNKLIAVTSYREEGVEELSADRLFAVGTLASILSVERQQGGNLQVVLEGMSRVELTQIDNLRPFFMATPREITEPVPAPGEADAMIQHIQELAAGYAKSREGLTSEVLDMIQRATNPGHLADLLTTQLITDVGKRQELLETADPLRRLEQIGAHLSSEIDVHDLEQKIRERVRAQMDDEQRKYYLTQQRKIIDQELGGEDADEFQELRVKIQGRGFPKFVEEKLLREMTRLERMPNVSAESTVARTYIETMLALPWHETTEDRIDLAAAEEVLNQDHYGLETVKERILEFLAVRKLTLQAGTRSSSQILCLWGPPGVGKTSLGRSVAEAMGRNFVRVSLGGLRDEAEIRGHRRTYIGAMPGRIINAMKTAGAMNPVILLDEIDKLASDYRGDPTAAMLEVLDPEQNRAFTDHYLDLPYDLSHALFITTANYAQQIPRPLRDRMEMIEVPGYTEDEKVEIASRHLLRRQLNASGLRPDAVSITPVVWKQIVRNYTKEAGVRGLDREVASLGRKVATQIVRGKLDPESTLVLTEDRLEEFLGPRKYGFEQDLGGSQIGLAIGLGVTEIGGEIIPVEVATMPGHGAIRVTGQAGDVMQESAHAAISYARSRADELHIDRDFHETLDLHIHLSEAATPKDGPSAGITMATALISALTRRPVRNDTAMTGEITLRGHVRPIGGLRDKALAAHRHGYRRLIAPRGNQRDLRDVPLNIRDEMEFLFVSTMDQVIQAAIMLDSDQSDQLIEVTDHPFGPVPPMQPDIIDARGAQRID